MRATTPRRDAPRLSDYEAGEIAYQNEMLRQQLERARKRHWTQSPILAVVCCAIIFFAGIRVAPSLYAWWYGWEETGAATTAPLPTAAVPTRGVPTQAPPAAPAADYGIAAYNEQQRARAATFAQEDAQEASGQVEAPTADNPAASEAAIEAWLAAPPSTPTPLPEPGEPGFVASFEEAPACSPFIGYLPGDPCIPELTAIAAGE